MENCSLCLNYGKDFHIINEYTKEILAVIFENNKLQLTQGHAVCEECFKKIEAAFSFKCTCINTEDFLVPFIGLKGKSHIDLKQLTVTVNANEELIEIPKGYEVCRLCLDLVNKNLISLLNETQKDRLQTFIPKLILENTLNPVVCETCCKLLEQHATFISNSLQLQEKTKADRERSTNECREAKAQTDANYENQRNFEKESTNNFDETELSNSKPIDEEYNTLQRAINKQRPKNGECKENSRKGIICRIDLRLVNFTDLNNKKQRETKVNETKKHVTKHLYPNIVKITKCDDTSTSTTLKKSPPEKNSDEKKMYKCNKCEFQTALKCELTLHESKHKENPPKIVKYTCGSCSYKTKCWNSLKLHKLIHKHSIGVPLHKCHLCLYETKHKESLELHILKHNNLDKMPVYQCKSPTKTKHIARSHKSSTWHKSTKTPKDKYAVYSSKTRKDNSLKSYKMDYKPLTEIQMHTDVIYADMKPSTKRHLSAYIKP